MSILDTFFILFKSNAKETEKDFDALGKKTKQTQEDIDRTDKSTRQLGLTFDDFVKALVTASGIDFSIKGLVSATKNIADMEVSVGRLSKLTGISASDIGAWDNALQRFGAPAGAFEAWLSSVNAQYQALGQGDNVKNILPNIIALADKWKDLNISQKEFYARQFGLTDDMVLAFDKGGVSLQGLIEQMKDAQRITERDTEASLALENAWKNTEARFTSVYHDMVPGLTSIAGFVDGIAISLDHLFKGEWKEFFLGGLPSLLPEIFGHPATSARTGASGSSSSQVLPLISQYESSNRNVLNGSGPGGTPASTASGYYQIINGTWRQFAPQAGVSLTQYPTAMSAPLDLQTKVAGLIYDQQGIGPWGSDQRLMTALAARNIAADNSPNSMPAAGNKSTNVTIGNITINTQASDAHGLATDLNNNLASQMRSAIGSFDDGILW